MAKFIGKKTTAIILLLIFFATITVIYIEDKEKTQDLEMWSSIPWRRKIVPYLLDISEIVQTPNAQSLSINSPIYGNSRNEITMRLGPPDDVGTGVYMYYIGRLDNSWIVDYFFKQSAWLYLYFVNDECVKYRIST